MFKLTIVRKLTDAEKELRRMEVRLKKHVSRGRKRPFTELRGLWKEAGAISEEKVRKAEIHRPGVMVPPSRGLQRLTRPIASLNLV